MITLWVNDKDSLSNTASLHKLALALIHPTGAMTMAGYKHRQQVRLGFLCAEELASQLDDTAKKRNIALTELIRQAVVAYLEQ